MVSLIHEFLEPRVRESTVSDFYPHIYGGTARDIYVTREQFARFWRMSVEYIDSMPFNQKVFDQMEPGGEALGYILKEWVYEVNNNRRSKYTEIRYRITIISYKCNPWEQLLDNKE